MQTPTLRPAWLTAPVWRRLCPHAPGDVSAVLLRATLRAILGG